MERPPDAAAPGRRHGVTVLVLAVLVLFIDGYDLFVLGTAGPALVAYESWDVSTATIGTLGSITALGMPVGTFLAGRASDALGRRVPIAAALGWMSACMLLSALAPSLFLFAASRFLTGLGLGALIPLVIALVVDWAPPHRRSLHAGIALSGIGLGGVAVACAGRITLPETHFQWLFAAGVLPLVLVPLYAKLLPKTPPPHATAPDLATPPEALEVTDARPALFAPARRRATLAFCLASFLGLVLIYGASSWLPTLLIRAGYDLSSALEFTIAFNAGAIGGTLLLSLAADRGHQRSGIALLFLGAAVAMLALTTHQPRWLLLSLCALAGLGTLGTQNLINAYVARYYPPRLRGTALGFTLGTGRFGSVAGPSYLTLVTTLFTTPDAGFYAFALPALLGATTMALIPARART